MLVPPPTLVCTLIYYKYYHHSYFGLCCGPPNKEMLWMCSINGSEVWTWLHSSIHMHVTKVNSFALYPIVHMLRSATHLYTCQACAHWLMYTYQTIPSSSSLLPHTFFLPVFRYKWYTNPSADHNRVISLYMFIQLYYGAWYILAYVSFIIIPFLCLCMQQ